MADELNPEQKRLFEIRNDELKEQPDPGEPAAEAANVEAIRGKLDAALAEHSSVEAQIPLSAYEASLSADAETEAKHFALVARGEELTRRIDALRTGLAEAVRRFDDASNARETWRNQEQIRKFLRRLNDRNANLRECQRLISLLAGQWKEILRQNAKLQEANLAHVSNRIGLELTDGEIHSLIATEIWRVSGAATSDYITGRPGDKKPPISLPGSKPYHALDGVPSAGRSPAQTPAMVARLDEAFKFVADLAWGRKRFEGEGFDLPRDQWRLSPLSIHANAAGEKLPDPGSQYGGPMLKITRQSEQRTETPTLVERAKDAIAKASSVVTGGRKRSDDGQPALRSQTPTARPDCDAQGIPLVLQPGEDPAEFARRLADAPVTPLSDEELAARDAASLDGPKFTAQEAAAMNGRRKRRLTTDDKAQKHDW